MVFYGRSLYQVLLIMNRKKAIKELRKVNNELAYLKKQKKSLIEYINKENDRLKGIASPQSKAWELKKDSNFIAEHGRERTSKEIGRLMGYSERQIQRFLNNKKEE